MSESVLLKIYDIVGGPIWVSADDGQRVHEKIVSAFKAGRIVDLSFANRENLITAFLNAAVGRLYSGDYSDEFLERNLRFVEITDSDAGILQRAVQNAKRYFANKPQYDEAWKEEIGDEEE